MTDAAVRGHINRRTDAIPKCIRIGRRVAWKREDVSRWLDENEKLAPEFCCPSNAERVFGFHIPAWEDASAIEAVYEESRRISESTGIPHHVDHIVPRSGKFVCGLHTVANLRIITAEENNRKNNKFSG